MLVMTKRRQGLLQILLLLTLTVPGWAFGMEGSAGEETPEVDLEGRDPLGRDTPRGAVEGYLRALDAGDDQRASEYLDLRNLPAEIAQYTPEQLARGLSIVLERSTWIDLELLSNNPQGFAGDGLPDYRDLLVELSTGEKSVPVMLQRVPDGAGGRIWKFSNATIAELDVLYEQYRYNAYVEWLLNKLPDVTFFGLELFKWVAALITMFLAAPFVLLLGWLSARLLASPGSPRFREVRRFMFGPVTLFVLIVLGNEVITSLGLGLTAQQVGRSYTVLTAATIWLLWQGVNLFRTLYSRRLTERGRGASVALIRPLTTALKVIIFLLGVLVWLDNLGFQITAVLTGLGIGGVAVALVLQKPLEDVFGAITLYTQQPVKIGDFGRFGTTTGTVEEISLRTTRIRTLANSLVSIPNMRLASEPIENLSAREKYLFSPVLRLEGDAKPEALESLLERIREMLTANSRVLADGLRVRFTAITLAGFDVSVFAYIDAADWADYLTVAEELNFGMLRLVSASELTLTTQGAVLSTSLE
jgi:MscS family membrane protein